MAAYTTGKPSHRRRSPALFGVISYIQKTNLFLQRENSAFLTPRGLLLRRRVIANKPLIPIGKEIERKSQEGEDISVLDDVGPVQYHPRRTVNTRPADAALIVRARRFSKKSLRRESGVSQHAIDRFLDGERIQPATRKKLAQTVENLERPARPM